jgi:hypothetical protein
MYKKSLFLLMTMCAMAITATAQREAVKIPDELKEFLLHNTKPIEMKSADLNGDGKADYIMVLTSTNVEAGQEHNDESRRITLIIVRKPEGELSIAARNHSVAFCAGCGGAMGDPFEGVEVKKGSFTITNSGGSRDRWSSSFQFNYSRKDNAWQLVKVTETSRDSLKANSGSVKVMTPPKHYGKIDFVDFDPDDFKGKGKK